MDGVQALQNSANSTSTPSKISSQESATPAWAQEIIRLLEKQNEYFAALLHITELNGKKPANGQENPPISKESTVLGREDGTKQTQVPHHGWAQILEQQIDTRTVELLSPPEKRRLQEYNELTARPQPWNEWAYRSTYAYLTQFLQRVCWTKGVSRVQVSVKDWAISESGTASVVSSCIYDGKTSGFQTLWETLRQRAAVTEHTSHSSTLDRLRLAVQRSKEQRDGSAPFGKTSTRIQTPGGLQDYITRFCPLPPSTSNATSSGIDMQKMASARIVQATDISPAICTLLLGSASM